MKKVFIYARVSTDKQETDRQINDLRLHCERNGYQVIQEYKEHISATKSLEKRQHLIDEVVKSGADIFLAQDLSRFSRNVKVGLQIKDELHKAGVCLEFTETGLKSLNENGTSNPMAQMVFVCLMNVYEMENATKKEMIKSGLRKAVERGKTLGRPKGSKENLIKKYPKVVGYLKNHSVRETSRLTSKPKSLVQRVRQQMVA
jgi:DNA invertase Pin-like site-specific DNA recombinase